MVNNTVIDWFVPWPEQALLSVAGVRTSVRPCSRFMSLLTYLWSCPSVAGVRTLIRRAHRGVGGAGPPAPPGGTGGGVGGAGGERDQ